jgi:hypothetical protein
MNRRLVLSSACVLVLGTAGALVGLARAQARSFPDPNDVRLTPQSNIGTCQMCTTLVQHEPPGGFAGACLFDSMTYQPRLPLACYEPQTSVRYGPAGGGFTNVIFPDATQVARSYSTLPAANDSYMVLGTCYPLRSASDGGGAALACPQSAFMVSHSCCDYGSNMISLDGKTAQGIAFFQ